jgi:hypothetical protein
MLSITDMQKAYKERILIEQKMSKGEFDNHPWQFCPTLSRFVANSNITSRWWERRIANLLDWDTQPKSKDPNDEQDYGDLFAPPFVLGEDNIELKTNEKFGRPHIVGQQFRFYENIPYYMMFKIHEERDEARCFMFSKQDIYREIFEYKSSYPWSSQGSGKTTGLNETQRLRLIEDSFEGKNQILWGFGINPKSKQEVYQRWCETYLVDIHSLQGENGWRQYKLDNQRG